MKRILVVEDDLALSAGLCFELDSGGYISVSAYTYQKAFQLVKEDRFDLVLLDVNLPDGNGFDLCKAIKALRPEIPVIFLTANDLEQNVLDGFDLGAEDYVTKPFSMKILLRRVEAVLVGRDKAKRKNPPSVGAMVTLRWTLVHLLPNEAGRPLPLHPMNISCCGYSPILLVIFSPGKSFWNACGTAVAILLMIIPLP